MKPALNTVTLRALNPQEIVSTMKELMVDSVEWAGDVHVPPGDLKTAEQVRDLCAANAIDAISYASYYQCDREGQGNGPFQFDLGAEAALKTAKALGVSALRVWAGRKGSETASSAYRDEVVERLKSLCDQAGVCGITVHLEYHRNTLTDTAASTLALIEAVNRKNLYTYWQPRNGESTTNNLADLEILAPYLSHLHVFHWTLDSEGLIQRHPLSDGAARWESYFEKISQLPGERYAMIEFVKDNSLNQLQSDLKTLRSLLETFTKPTRIST